MLSSSCVSNGNTQTEEAAAYTDVKFDSTKLYSKLIIDSRINDFYANTKLMGFNVYDADGNLLKESAGSKNLKFDYVPGLVAKALIEGAAYYQDSTFARAWYYMVEDYANRFAESVPTTGGSLDNLNATKMYPTLLELTRMGGAFESIANPATYQNALSAMQKAIQGLSDANQNFVIDRSVKEDAAGGWYHKSSYPNQMWCDGQYMGPALLGQLLQNGYRIDTEFNDWMTITRQFDITWHYLWDADKQLLWHAFSADPTGEKAKCWADPVTGRSQEYWGRACGWYMLALVDVLEMIPTDIEYAPTQSSLAGYSVDCRTRLMQYLEKLSAGLKARQDAKTGCWYQLLAYDNTFSADTYQGKSYTRTYNYLESSASAIFTAAYLKAVRLGYLSADEYRGVAIKGYQGFINEFVKLKSDGTYTLVNSCASAGLGNSTNRDGSAAYYLLGSDVTRVTNYTEGKVLGAFILAAIEYERLMNESKNATSDKTACLTPDFPISDKSVDLTGKMAQNNEKWQISKGRVVVRR